MLKPRELVGHEYVVRAITNLGLIHRRLIALDTYDARAQMVEYCLAKGLIPVRVAVN